MKFISSAKMKATGVLHKAPRRSRIASMIENGSNASVEMQTTYTKDRKYMAVRAPPRIARATY